MADQTGRNVLYRLRAAGAQWQRDASAAEVVAALKAGEGKRSATVEAALYRRDVVVVLSMGHTIAKEGEVMAQASQDIHMTVLRVGGMGDEEKLVEAMLPLTAWGSMEDIITWAKSGLLSLTRGDSDGQLDISEGEEA